ncbi:hypothetical protein [Nocardia arthritidis]|uniref:Uncharacterized protein n=1 Tax=Nocardia arthritidis TaxID=228602 RepID=A0A6G9Y916_9NOCA|nr:hypothetical protein [Nocardia arthritidis]QIS09668.1 hypothetical protein F5544_08830 [Nocardia arthritidis]
MSETSAHSNTRGRNVIRRAVVGPAAATLAAVALTVAAAPDAGAAVIDLRAEPGASWGPASQYGTGCTYTLTANLTTGAFPVFFYDTTGRSTFAPSDFVDPAGATSVSVQWTPTAAEWHHIVAYQSQGSIASVDLLAGTGFSTGSGCAVMP